MVFRRQRLTIRQTLRRRRQLAIMRRLIVIDPEIVKTRRIEQSQSLKMCFLSVAIRCRAQENYMFCLSCQLLDQRKLGAIWLQVMHLVDDDYIPRTLHEGFTDVNAEWTDKELGVEQLLGQILALDINRAAFIRLFPHHPQSQIKTQIGLGQPLVHQRRRHQDQSILHSAGQQQPMQNQQRLDRLAQTDLVGEQYPHTMALANFSSNRQLMVKEPNPPPEEAAYR